MQSPSEYRKQAEVLVLEAQTASAAQRVRLLQMAQSLLRLADQAQLLQAEDTMAPGGNRLTPGAWPEGATGKV
jgi:hypothetical protein